MRTQRCNECGWPAQVLHASCFVCGHVNVVPWQDDGSDWSEPREPSESAQREAERIRQYPDMLELVADGEAPYTVNGLAKTIDTRTGLYLTELR